MQSKSKIQKYSYLSRINVLELVNEAKQRLSLKREPFYNFTILRNYPFLRSFYRYVHDFVFFQNITLVSSFSRLMEYAARKSNTTSILLTLCPGYKLFTPNFKSAYLSLLNIVHCSFDYEPFLFHFVQHAHIRLVGSVSRAFFQMPWNIPQDFRFIILQTWSRVALLIPRLRVLRFTKFVFFQCTVVQWSKHFIMPVPV